KFTLSWLKEHLDTDASVDEIAAKLTSIGLEVEGLEDPGKSLAPFIVGEVLEADKHPNADRLKLCKVSTGTSTLQVVCGAPNARAGIKVVLAQPGAVIPATGDVLKKGSIRGVESQGMMCSSRELKLGDDHDGIIELPASAKTGAPVATVLNSDPVFEIALTPNRVDALGVRGVARDLAAAGLGTLKSLDESAVKGSYDAARKVAMRLPADKSHLCPQFVGRQIKGVKNGPSPAWLADRLKAIGLRPVSALVDITQYINIDLGRPLHVFDNAKLSGDVGPRLAKGGEKLAALNGKEYELDESIVVIADDANAVGIGGVMGGEPTSVNDATIDIYLESALFDPFNIAATGRKLQINSDARYCFERGVDPTSATTGAEIATRLIVSLCGGEASHVVVGGAAPAWTRSVAFDPAKVKTLGGVDLSDAEIKGALERLGFLVKTGSPWQVSPPSWRADVTLWQDLVEDVIRVTGYDNIPATPLPRPETIKPALNAAQRNVNQAKRTLAARGLCETVTWAFLPKAHAELFVGGMTTVPLDNPISADLDVLRPSVIPNLVAAAGRNAARGLGDSNLFEVGPRFTGFKPGDQDTIAGGIRAGHTSDRHWTGARRTYDAFDAKADAVAVLMAVGVNPASLQTAAAASDVASWYHPGRGGAVKLGNQVLATFGELHPRVLGAFDMKGPVAAFEVHLDNVPPAKKSKTGAARPLLKASPYQPVDRDFAFVVDVAVTAEAVLRAVRNAERELITDVGLFDVYEGKNIEAGKKSLAVTVRLQSKSATLTDAEIEAAAAKIVAAVTKATGATLRA
ncbi:MAG: phenylalanine--tRNA ligase subunit beta, partial [Rhodobacteraceae bacterium]|nr:phenylalanine--tRNA ligase subunit beta [Paracoccaceae bacterium]